MAVRGNINGLKELADKIRTLTGAGFKRELSQALAVSAWQQTLASFDQSRDPYGTPWKPLKVRQGKPLIDTGQMRQSVSTEATDNGFRLRIGTTYAPVHQFGTDRIPARPMIPLAEQGLGPIWEAAFNKVASDLIRQRLGKAA